MYDLECLHPNRMGNASAVLRNYVYFKAQYMKMAKTLLLF